MFSIPTEALPPTLVAAAVLWAGAHYVVVGPAMAERVVRADHVPACRADFETVAAQAGEERLKGVEVPSLDAEHAFVVEQARRVLDSPGMQHLNAMGGGLAEMFGLDVQGAARHSLANAERAKREAEEAYRAARARIEAETATTLGRAGDVCGCLGDAAITATRTEWAIFSGSLGLIAPAPLPGFSAKMAELQRAGACGGEAGR